MDWGRSRLFTARIFAAPRSRRLRSSLSSGRSRSAPVSAGPRGGGFVFPNFGSRLVFVCVGRSAYAAVPTLHVVDWGGFWSFSLRIGFGRSSRAVVSFHFPMLRRLALAAPRQQVGISPRKLSVYKYPTAYTRCGSRPPSQSSRIRRPEWPKQTPT